MALTATATAECQQDIKKLLKLAKDCRHNPAHPSHNPAPPAPLTPLAPHTHLAPARRCVESSFNRPNLHYRVKRMRMDEKGDALLEYVKEWPKGTSGLVCRLSRYSPLAADTPP